MTDFAHAVLPDGVRIYVVGDVHGCLDALREVEAAIDRDLRRRPETDVRIVLLGDYVDRGADSGGVLDWVVSRAERRTVIPLLGNHDDMMRRFLADPEGDAYAHWTLNGGDATLASLGLPAPMALGPRQGPERRALRERLSDALGPRRRTLLDRLRRMYRAGDYVFVHAGVRPGIALEDQDPEDLIWIRQPFLDTDADLGAVIVHGHTPTPAVSVRPHRIGIDTGACFGGDLTCLVLEGAEKALLTGDDTLRLDTAGDG